MLKWPMYGPGHGWEGPACKTDSWNNERLLIKVYVRCFVGKVLYGKHEARGEGHGRLIRL